MPSLSDYDLAELQAELLSAGHKSVHAATVLRHFHKNHGRMDPEQIPVSHAVRKHLQERLAGRASRVAMQTVAADGTAKLLVAFGDGKSVEAVLMPGVRDGVAAGCVSSQVGCAMGCDFCASTRNGLARNLTAGEIVEQFLHLRQRAEEAGRRLKTLVFMGMGEPLLNFEAVTAAIRRISHPDLGNLGRRQITVSTVGIVPGMDRLAEADLNVQLALSLHGPDDATRSRLVPMNRRWKVTEIMAAAKRYQERTGRLLNIEYCMLAGVNDSDEQAVLLAELMRGFRAHVNLIPYNAIGAGVSGVCYSRPTRERMLSFINLLRERGVVTHFRVTRGDDVSAACGQLQAAAGSV